MKKIQNFYLFSYRLVGFVFLIGLISSILWYGFSILFFLSNSSWSVPMVLSPDQEKVMTHLEHVLILEHDIRKDSAELTSFQQDIKHKRHLLKTTEKLVDRFTQSMSTQSNQYSKNSILFKRLSQEKSANVVELNSLMTQIQTREQVTDQELKNGLITKQEALAAHLSLSKVRSDLVDAKLSMHELRERAHDFADAAGTLSGYANNLQSIDKVVKRAELESQKTQLESDIFSLNVRTNQLHKSITEKQRVIALMKNSPYIRATHSLTTVAFAPYSNLKNIEIGDAVYSCYLEMILCYKSGYVSELYSAEEYSKHPIFKSDIKGQLVGIKFKQSADGQKKLLFLKSKPLLL